MVILGIILLILGFFFHVPILTELGIVLLVIGAILGFWLGRPPGRRSPVLVLTASVEDGSRGCSAVARSVSQDTHRNGIALAQPVPDTGSCDAAPSLC